MKKKIIIAVFAALSVIAAAMIGVKFAKSNRNTVSTSTDTTAVSSQLKLPYTLSNGCEIAEIKSYSGPFVEDGSDVEKTDVFALVIKNTTGKHFQYMTVNIQIGGNDYNFKLTTLFDNSAVTVLESTGAPYNDQKIDTVTLTQSVEFSSDPTVHPKELEITVMDGLMNVKNISGKDITSDIYVYYKLTDGDDWFGGITYRANVGGGLKNGELRQIPANHFKKESCKVVFTEYEQ
ncbi:MAG: hypothetical protein ACI4XE_08250 [Acutalibacteraceae bacterium]